MRATEFITELFSTKGGLPIEWENHLGSVLATATDHNTGRTLEIHFWTLPESAVEIDFMVDDTYQLTNKGDQFLIFATVVNAIREYDERYAPKYLIFSAKEQNRKSLYKQMINRLAPTLGYTVGNIHDIPQEVHDAIQLNPNDFVLIHKSAFVDEAETPIGSNEENMTRRGFLGALGALATTGAQSAVGIRPPKEFNLLGNNPNNELPLQKTAYGYGLKGPELAQFLGQMKHESWNFERLKEKPMGKGYFEKRYGIKYAPQTAKILGNKYPGDGEKYHGRGYVQLTGRDNYRMASQALGIDLLKNPDLAANPEVAAKIAIWYWNTRVKPNVTNFADTATVTKAINPAMRGLQDRHENFKDYLKVLA